MPTAAAAYPASEEGTSMKQRNFAIAAGVAALAGLGAVAVSHASPDRASQLTNSAQTIPAARTYLDSTSRSLAETSSPALAFAQGSSGPVMTPVSYPTERVVYRN